MQRTYPARLDDLQLDLRMLLAKRPQNIGEKDHAELQRHREAHLGVPVCHIADLIIETRHLAEDVRHLAQQLRAVARNGDLAPLPMKEV